ncbi:3-oxoacyl-ACP synthase [Bacillus massilinigeriensis]|uniref:3-oxoacyl-ACP synthase n=1 Tax=Bacillus massilionigeriensis TaxID=1805475 RepID=UPI00096B46D8|nr:3-oxoacyl-ACP synthase [Bacillus massilionigeriensis]
MDNIGIEEINTFFPKEIQSAAFLSKKTGIPKNVIIEKFGLYQKHVADETMQSSDLAIEAARPILEKIDPLSIDVLIYFGSPHKDYYVWPIAPKIQHELGAKNAYAFEIMNVSSCFPIALKVAKDMLKSDKTIQAVLLVGGCKESQIIDYENPRSRFMFNFADGGCAALVKRGATKSEILESSIMTDGSFHEDVLVPAGGSKYFTSFETVEKNMHYIDVPNPQSMKERLDPVSVRNFETVIRQSLNKSRLSTKDINLLLPLHTKRSMFMSLLSSLELEEEQTVYLDHYGHMSALDPCVGLHIAAKQGRIKPGDIAVTVSAGTGYTWASTVLQWKG